MQEQATCLSSPLTSSEFVNACRLAAETAKPLCLTQGVVVTETITLRGKQHLVLRGVVSSNGSDGSSSRSTSRPLPPTISGDLHSLFLLNNSSRLTLEHLQLQHTSGEEDCRQVGAAVNLRYKSQALLRHCSIASNTGFCAWAVQKSTLQLRNCTLKAPLRSAVVCFGQPRVTIFSSTIADAGVHGICARGSNDGCRLMVKDCVVRDCAMRGLYAYARVTVTMEHTTVSGTLRSDTAAVEVCQFEEETKGKDDHEKVVHKTNGKVKPKSKDNSQQSLSTSLTMKDCQIVDNAGVGVRIRGNVQTNDIPVCNSLEGNRGGNVQTLFATCKSTTDHDRPSMSASITRRDESGSSFRHGDWQCPSCVRTIVPGSKENCPDCNVGKTRGTSLTSHQVLQLNQGKPIDEVIDRGGYGITNTTGNLPVMWYFDADQDHGHTWIEYDQTSEQILESAYQQFCRNENENNVLLMSGKYQIDFCTMQQINTMTHFPRFVRRQCCNDASTINSMKAKPKSILEQLREIVDEPIPDSISEPPVQVMPWLYLGPRWCLQDLDRLQNDIGISHVLSMNAMQPESRAQEMYYTLWSHGIDHAYVQALDILTYPLLPKHWEECRAFLQPIHDAYCEHVENVESDDNGVSTKSFPKVFVHCEAGINRSGTIVAAAMMYFAGMNLLDAAQQLKRQRGIIMTNATFQEQLVEFAERLASERE
jgi:hypothetical protein